MRGELAWTCQKRAAWQQKHTKQPCAGQVRPSNPQVGHNPVCLIRMSCYMLAMLHIGGGAVLYATIQPFRLQVYECSCLLVLQGSPQILHLSGSCSLSCSLSALMCSCQVPSLEATALLPSPVSLQLVHPAPAKPQLPRPLL